jgi:hypothetical protein
MWGGGCLGGGFSGGSGGGSPGLRGPFARRSAALAALALRSAAALSPARPRRWDGWAPAGPRCLTRAAAVKPRPVLPSFHAGWTAAGFAAELRDVRPRRCVGGGERIGQFRVYFYIVTSLGDSRGGSHVDLTPTLASGGERVGTRTALTPNRRRMAPREFGSGNRWPDSFWGPAPPVPDTPRAADLKRATPSKPRSFPPGFRTDWTSAGFVSELRYIQHETPQAKNSRWRTARHGVVWWTD